MDQTEYASSLHIIAHPGLSIKKSEDAVSAELHSPYWSLLGAVALLLLTRADVAVYVYALQRWGHAPKVIHDKRLNVLTKWIQANPTCLVHRTFSARVNRQVDTGSRQRASSESMSKKKEQTGYCMRGAADLSCVENSDDASIKTTICHSLDLISRRRW